MTPAVKGDHPIGDKCGCSPGISGDRTAWTQAPGSERAAAGACSSAALQYVAECKPGPAGWPFFTRRGPGARYVPTLNQPVLSNSYGMA